MQNKIHNSNSSSQKIKNKQNDRMEPTTRRVQKLKLVCRKQAEGDLFRNFIFDFTVLSPQDNVQIDVELKP